MARENLVPVPTVDRNGRTTTVYRRGDQQTVVRMLPTPGLAPRDMLRENLSLIKEMVGLETDGECRLLLSNLSSYRTEFQQELNMLLTQDDEVLASAMAAHVLNRDTETFIRECASFLPELDVDDLEYGAVLVSSLRLHNDLPWAADYSKVDDRTRAQCLALMHTVAAVESISDYNSPEIRYQLKDGQTSIPILNDSHLVTAVLDEPEDAELIISLIREYRTGFYAPIREILDGSNPSLSIGAL